MAKKIKKEEFEQRIKDAFPQAEFEIIYYEKISGYCEIKCLKCGKVIKYQKASTVLRHPFCCTEQNSWETAKRRIDKTEEFHYINKDDRDIIIKHDKCGQTFKRNIYLVIKNPNHCPYCSDNKGVSLTLEQAQKQIDENFFGTIKVLQYNAIRTKNTYKCLKCGLIFQQTQKNLLASRGCPKCDRFKSKGEKRIAVLLKDNNLYFKEQVSFKELSNEKQRFDFVVYKDKECTQIDYFIECQGEQHYEEKDFFKDSLKTIQERDQRKRNFCSKLNIPLYEIIYKDEKFLNLDILPFYKN